MVMATLRPRSAPSASLLLEMAFSTCECWAAQPILRCPSGARAGFFMTDSRIITPPVLVLNPQFTGTGSAVRPLGPLPEHLFEHLRAVSHDNVDTEIKETPHLSGVVY